MKYRHNLLRLSILILFTLLLRAENVAGQNYIAFTPTGFSGWPDSIPRGDTVTVGGWLKNYSLDSTFHDALYIDGTVDTGAGPMSFSFDFSFLQATFQLPPGDSGFMLVPFVFDTGSGPVPQFHVGNNVVVVWPIGVGPGSFLPSDSVELNVFVIDTLNSVGPDLEMNRINIYPIPSNGPLYITPYHQNYRVTRVVIRDASGQEMYHSENASGPIDTGSWAPGLYVVETTLSNGDVSYCKILRQ